MSKLIERIDLFLNKAYHPLHGMKFRHSEQAGRKLSNLGAKHIKTIPRENTKTRVYQHPDFGTFTTVESGRKTTIFHYPKSKKNNRLEI